MIRFVARRLAASIPTIVGISLVTFVLLHLAMGQPETVADTGGSADVLALDSQTARELGRPYGLHLPLFVNLSIDDVRSRTAREIESLGRPGTGDRAVRSLASIGGAALPHLVPALPQMAPEQRAGALAALEPIARRIGLDSALSVAPDAEAFWTRYWSVYGSDFTPVRAARLTRRLMRRDDELARTELERLDTFCLPQIMAALAEDPEPAAQARLADLAGRLVGREDPIDPAAPAEDREAVVSRWLEWWQQRYDLYTSFDGIERVTGAVTETRYFRWLGRIVTFDFGISLRDGRSVRTKLAERLPVTLLLSVLALLTAYGLAIPIGVISAARRGGPFDRATTVLVFVLYSLPAFWVAMLLLRYLGGSGHLEWFPSQGLSSVGSEAWPWWRRALDTAHHLVLPVVCLSFVSTAVLARYQRVGMLDVIEKDFMRTARAKGLGRARAIVRHGLRNGIVPVITMLGVQIPYLVSGSVVVERIFGIPGMGLETFEAIQANDHAWLMAVVTVTAVFTVIGLVAADVIYALVDPRIVPGRRLGRAT